MRTSESSIRRTRSVRREKPELIKAVHEIEKCCDAKSSDGDRFLTTTIDRNLAGFVRSVQQGDVKRTYYPRTIGISVGTTRLSSWYDPESGTTAYGDFDEGGRPGHVNTPDGSRYDYTYDDAGRVTTVSQARRGSSAAGISGITEYDYDATGRLSALDQGGVRRDYTYNGAGLLESEMLSVDEREFELSYRYDSLGAISNTTYPSGRSVSMAADAFGRTTSVAGFVTDAAYHANGLLESYALSNGVEFSLELDVQQRPRVRRVSSGRGASLLETTTTYDARDNVTAIYGHLAPSGLGISSGEHDGLSRLVSMRRGVGKPATYSYDQLGNLRSYDRGDYSMTYAYDSRNRLESTASSGSSLRALSHGERTVAHDDLGNIVAHGEALYEFDGQSRLVESRHDDFVQRNRYDGAGMRVKSVTTEAIAGADPRTTTTWYVYGKDGALLHERELESGEMRDHIRLDGRTIATVGRHTGYDSDGDSMPDYYERLHGLNPYRNDAHRDSDGDGATNRDEHAADTSPVDADSDSDGVPDGDEDVMETIKRERVVNEPVFTYLLSR